MHSVDKTATAQVSLNHEIPSFPATPGGAGSLSGKSISTVEPWLAELVPAADTLFLLSTPQCRQILTALNLPIPTRPNNSLRYLQSAVRKAIGLSAA